MLQGGSISRGGGVTPLYGLYRDVPQGMVFVLSALNRVYNFARVCAKQGI